MGIRYYDPTNYDLYFGSQNGDRKFKGCIDEAVLSSTVRTDSWIRLCFQNQREDQTLVSFEPSNGNGHDGMRIVAQVAYVDNKMVHTWSDAAGGLVFDYENIVSPAGLEGRIEHHADGTREALYYTKDHLGNTRQTIRDNGEVIESMRYLAFQQSYMFNISI